jgi:predicted Zn-dependent peptidase
LSGATIGTSLFPALAIVADMVRQPSLPDEEFEPIRALLTQTLRSIEDDPASKAAIELRRVHYPDPWGRPTQGTIEGLASLTAAEVRSHFQRVVQPHGALLAVAGAVEWNTLLKTVEHLFGDWEEGSEPAIVETPPSERRTHLTKETQQIQIGEATPAVGPSDPQYYSARAVAAVLGGYSSSRLFTEIREKRGLCYSIYAGYESVRAHSAIVCGAATAPDRAQETLDLLRIELERLRREGVSSDELETMRAGLKASLVMQQESSSARAMALAGDMYHLGRVRPVSEIADALDALTAQRVSDYCASLPIDESTYLTLGPQPLEFDR